MDKCLECLLLLKHTFFPKLFFPEGIGGVQNSSGNSGGVGGGVILVVKKWKLRGGGGLREIPSVVGVWIISGTTYTIQKYCKGNQSLSLWTS